MSDLPRQFGGYSLLKMLAKGGMGEIYLARSTGFSHFEKYYAIKKLLKKFTHDQDVGARFVDEAKLGARLQHPNIVQVFDLGVADEELYMACEFVDGFDLRRVLRFCHEKKKRIPLDIALFMVREILSGLAYAHRQVDAEGRSIDLIHRDISPQNVLVSFEGEVKIIDFGLAKSTQRSQETQANVLLGNFGYMSPEQARGHRLDVRTDIYSTGIVLFELVTGTKRFVDDNPLRLLEMVARPTPIMPSDRSPDIPKAIDRIYAQATAPQKEDRFPNAEQARDAVTAAVNRINPRAGRESLAQFLNHLFLGGQAPPPVDNDLLDKSVMVQVQDLIGGTSDAFQKSKEDDVQDRSLTAFDDDAPQTGSHDLMRSARVGDSLSHKELTNDESSVEAPSPPPAFVTPPNTSTTENALPPQEVAVGSGIPDISTEGGYDDLSQQATSVYEAPAWSGAPTKVPPENTSPPIPNLPVQPAVPGLAKPPLLVTPQANPPPPALKPLPPFEVDNKAQDAGLPEASTWQNAVSSPKIESPKTLDQFPAVDVPLTPIAAPSEQKPAFGAPIQNLPPSAATQMEMQAVSLEQLQQNAPDEQAVSTAVPFDSNDELEVIELEELVELEEELPLVAVSAPIQARSSTSTVISSIVVEGAKARAEPENEPTMVVNMGSEEQVEVTGFEEGGMESLIIDFDSSEAEANQGQKVSVSPLSLDAMSWAPVPSAANPIVPIQAQPPQAQAPHVPPPAQANQPPPQAQVQQPPPQAPLPPQAPAKDPQSTPPVAASASAEDEDLDVDSGPGIRPAAQPMGRTTIGKTKPLGGRRR